MSKNKLLVIQCCYLENEVVQPCVIIELEGLLDLLSKYSYTFKFAISQPSSLKIFKMVFWDYNPRFVQFSHKDRERFGIDLDLDYQLVEKFDYEKLKMLNIRKATIKIIKDQFYWSGYRKYSSKLIQTRRIHFNDIYNILKNFQIDFTLFYIRCNFKAFKICDKCNSINRDENDFCYICNSRAMRSFDKRDLQILDTLIDNCGGDLKLKIK